jgi:hypothetical protein
VGINGVLVLRPPVLNSRPLEPSSRHLARIKFYCVAANRVRGVVALAERVSDGGPDDGYQRKR